MPELDKNKPMTFLEHLEELRWCLLRLFIAVVVSFAICYAFSEKIYNILLIPFNEAYRSVLHREPTLIYTTLFEPFMAYLKISFVAGIFLSSPYIFYELWRFIAPGLYKRERKLIIPFVTLAAIFFTGGALFGYFVVFPVGFKFFMSYTTTVIQPYIKVSDYLKISLGTLLIFGTVFEFPLVVLFLVYIRLISLNTLLSKWRYIIVGISIASAIFTPADAISMMTMMVPLLILYAITIIGAYFLTKVAKKDRNNNQA